MNLRLLFVLLALFIMALLAWLIWFTPEIGSNSEYALIAYVTFILFYLIYFYKKVVKPMETISNGMDLLKAQDFSSRLNKMGQPEADRVVELFNNLMDQLKNERLRLLEQNYFLDLLVDASPMGIIILNFDNQITRINPAAQRFLNIENIKSCIGKKIEKVPSLFAEIIARIPRNGKETLKTGSNEIYKCSHLTFMDRGFVHPFFLIESLTDEVMKAEKKAYEKLIRMIAHEVNNTTAGITSALDSVDDALRSMPDCNDLSEVTHICIERCFEMSQFITNFANVVKIPEPQFEKTDLNKKVSDCKLFMESICLQRNIKLHLHLACEEMIEDIDSTLFAQVLINIVKNAAESIGENGNIYIQTLAHPSQLIISDTGAGISPETAEKLFNPFFSTKPHGQGIGLIFVREILTKHGCSFTLRTESDNLTHFRIIFPIKK